MSLVLLVFGTVLIFVLEHDNPATLGGIAGEPHRWLAAFFQSASTRTAGFNSVSIIDLNHATNSFLRGNRTFSAFKRNIAPLVVLKSLAIIIGRVGSLTLAYVITTQRPTHILYADEDVATG